MHKILLGEFISAIANIAGLRTQMLAVRAIVVVPQGNECITEMHADQINNLKAKVAIVADVSGRIGFPATEIAAKRTVLYLTDILAKHLRGDTVRLDDGLLNGIGNQSNEITSRAIDEAGISSFLRLSADNQKLFEIDNPFGTSVEQAFPLASEDIAEAAKCLSLERSTATVFHLMRAMECSIQALAAKLQIANVERVWGLLLTDINKRIELMPKGPERNKWSEIQAQLHHVKQAWRNDTMHPKRTYTSEEATAIFNAVGVFMNSLAEIP